MKEGNNTTFSASNDFTKSLGHNHYSMIQASSVVELPNGKTKRLRHKSSYKEIMQEKANYITIDANLSGSLRSNHSFDASHNKSSLSPEHSLKGNSSYKSLYSAQAIKESQNASQRKKKSSNENLGNMSTISKRDKHELSILARDSSMKDLGIFDNKNIAFPKGGTIMLNRSYSNPSSTPLKQSTCSSHYDPQKLQASSNTNHIPISKSGLYAAIKGSCNGVANHNQYVSNGHNKSNERYDMQQGNMAKSQSAKGIGFNLNMVANSTRKHQQNRSDYYSEDPYAYGGGMSDEEYEMYVRSGELQLEDLKTEKKDYNHHYGPQGDTLMKTQQVLKMKRRNDGDADEEERRLKEKLEKDHKRRKEEEENSIRQKEYERRILEEERREKEKEKEEYRLMMKRMAEIEEKKEYERQMEMERIKEREIEIEKEREMEWIRQKEIEMKELEEEKKELERQQEIERQKEYERVKELERQKEIEKEMQRQRMIEIEKQKEYERQKEMEKQREMERQREIEMELERQQEIERQQEREIEKQKEIERLKHEEWLRQEAIKIEERRILLEKLKQEEIQKEEEAIRQKELKEHLAKQREIERLKQEEFEREEALRIQQEELLEEQQRIAEEEAILKLYLQREQERYKEELMLKREEESTRQKRLIIINEVNHHRIFRAEQKLRQEQLKLAQRKEREAQELKAKKLQQEAEAKLLYEQEQARVKEAQLKHEEDLLLAAKSKEDALLNTNTPPYNLNVSNPHSQSHSPISGKQQQSTPYPDNNSDEDSLVIIQSTQHNTKQQSMSKYNTNEEQNSTMRKIDYTEAYIIPSPTKREDQLLKHRQMNKAEHNESEMNEVNLNTNDYIYSDDDEKNLINNHLKRNGHSTKKCQHSNSDSKISICVHGGHVCPLRNNQYQYQEGCRNHSQDNRSATLKDQLNISNPEPFLTSSNEKNHSNTLRHIEPRMTYEIRTLQYEDRQARRYDEENQSCKTLKSSRINRPPVLCENIIINTEDKEELQRLYLKQQDATIRAKNSLNYYKEIKDNTKDTMRSNNNTLQSSRAQSPRGQLFKSNTSRSKLELIPFFQDTHCVYDNTKNLIKKLTHNSDNDDFYKRKNIPDSYNTIPLKERLLMNLPSHYANGEKKRQQPGLFTSALPSPSSSKQKIQFGSNDENYKCLLDQKQAHRTNSRSIMPANPFQTVLEAREFFFFHES